MFVFDDDFTFAYRLADFNNRTGNKTRFIDFAFRFGCGFQDDRTVLRCKKIDRRRFRTRYVRPRKRKRHGIDASSDTVSHHHFRKSFRDAARTDGIHRAYGAASVQSIEDCGILHKCGEIGSKERRIGSADEIDRVPRFFKRTARHSLRFIVRYGERHERVRNVYIFEGAAHTVFSADRRTARLLLRVERAEQSRRRIAPRLFIDGAAEVFLKRQAARSGVSADAHDLCKRGKHRRLGAVPCAPFADEGIEAERHHARRRGFTRRGDGNFCRHSRFGRTLIFSAERKQNGCSSDGTVEAFGKAAFGTAGQIVYICKPCIRKR